MVQTCKHVHSSLLNRLSWCSVCFLSALSQLKMTSKERFSVNEVLSHLFDHESDIEEKVSETGGEVPDDEASSSDENQTLSVDPPVVSQPPANTLLWSISPT